MRISTPIHRRPALAGAVLAAFLLGCSAPLAEESMDPDAGDSDAESRPPNIVLIVVDDMGNYDLSINGNPDIRTPNIDSIGHAGVRFSSGYVASPVCATSRAAMLTGRYSQSFGMEHNPTAPAFARALSNPDGGERGGTYREERLEAYIAAGTPAMPAELPTIAEILRDSGYHTALVGKWHLGPPPDHDPLAQGFDEMFGFYGGASLFAQPDDASVVDARLPWSNIDNFLWQNLQYTLVRNGQPVDSREYMTTALGNEAEAVIERNADRPFFLYLSFNAPHNPLQAPKAHYDRLSHIDDHVRRTYYAMVTALDDAVGGVLAALESHGLADNTIVVFVSDNGGADYTRIWEHNFPYRGWKGSFWEGGIAVPFMMRWPAAVTPGLHFSQPVSTLDLLPTFASAAGVDLSDETLALDGRDLTPFLTGAATGPVHDALVWRNEHNYAIRAGDWKLQVSALPERVWLYDVRNDRAERVNLAREKPEKVAELQRLFEETTRDFAEEPLWPSILLLPIYPDAPLGKQAEDDVDYVMWPG